MSTKTPASKEPLVLGIQGGKGSFNEEAARQRMKRTPDRPFTLSYLHTTENVLKALHDGSIDQGQFAIRNSLGGIVEETVEASKRYSYDKIDEFAMKIIHALMVLPDAEIDDIDTVMAHPQALTQCKFTLQRKYSHLKQQSGEGDLLDPAKVAELLSQGQLTKNIAVLGHKGLAEIYGLKIVANNMQDSGSSFTTFIWVKRPKTD